MEIDGKTVKLEKNEKVIPLSKKWVVEVNNILKSKGCEEALGIIVREKEVKKGFSCVIKEYDGDAEYVYKLDYDINDDPMELLQKLVNMMINE